MLKERMSCFDHLYSRYILNLRDLRVVNWKKTSMQILSDFCGIVCYKEIPWYLLHIFPKNSMQDLEFGVLLALDYFHLLDFRSEFLEKR